MICGGFAAVGPASRRYRSTAAWPAISSSHAAERRAAANAGSVTLSAGVGSRPHRLNCLISCITFIIKSVSLKKQVFRSTALYFHRHERYFHNYNTQHSNVLQKCNCTRPVGTKINKTMLHPDEHILCFSKWMNRIIECNVYVQMQCIHMESNKVAACYTYTSKLLVDVPSALLGPIVCWCRPWSCLPSAAGPSRSPDPPSGTAYRTAWYQRRLCPDLIPRHYHWSPVNYSPPPVDPEVILLLGPL